MRRTIKLALLAGAVATMAVPATPAKASICQSDPEIICTVIYLGPTLICKITKGEHCMT